VDPTSKKIGAKFGTERIKIGKIDPPNSGTAVSERAAIPKLQNRLLSAGAVGTGGESERVGKSGNFEFKKTPTGQKKAAIAGSKKEFSPSATMETPCSPRRQKKHHGNTMEIDLILVVQISTA